METIRRNWLRKQVELGRVEAKCEMHLTDDYAFDAAYNFGQTDWKPARIRQPKWEVYVNERGSALDRCVDDDLRQGFINFLASDFSPSYKTGHAYWQNKEQGLIHFSIHSNLRYTLRIVEARHA